MTRGRPSWPPTALLLAAILLAPLLLALTPFSPAAAADPPPLSGHAAQLYQQAKDTGRWFSVAARLNPEIRPTSDNQSFVVIWRAAPAPTHWIVSLHGAGRPAKGFATDDLAIWQPHLQGRDVGIVCLQWWLGQGDGPDAFYSPPEIYHEIDRTLTQLGVHPGTVMLEGFSRGSANSYAVAALDAGRGKHYFALVVASSGGVSLDYGPTQDILDGRYGEHPLKGTRWITVAGRRDPNPDRDGIPGMRRTADWLHDQGADVLLKIEDPNSGHGALMTNPENARQVLDRFLKPSQVSPPSTRGAK
jgi:hypothetical protein